MRARLLRPQTQAVMNQRLLEAEARKVRALFSVPVYHRSMDNNCIRFQWVFQSMLRLQRHKKLIEAQQRRDKAAARDRKIVQVSCVVITYQYLVGWRMYAGRVSALCTARCLSFHPMAQCVVHALKSKAWLAMRMSLWLARLPQTTSSAQRSRRLRFTRMALGTRRYRL